ncbi:hypothetical protein RhiirA5_398747 [Rhizophagus irregularis]|uniref:Uncharacterized protein n=2 Tax=Rhizophagus irregularis TaxID=588596 RepID=A0A2N0PRH4_9GLOM|nr:hypothetical protein RhiirA5_398747 [Rhizophagus irregularis]
MVAPHVRLSQSAEYRENYIVQGNVLWCRFCNTGVEHKRKDTVDKHLRTVKHLKNKTTDINSPIQRTIPSFENTISERERVNTDVVAAFTSADIPLEKIEKLKPFLLKYCKNGGLITGANQLREKYLPLSYEIEFQKLKTVIVNKSICLTIDETTDRCGRHAVNILFSFDNQTKLARTNFIPNVNASMISQFVIDTIHLYNIPYQNVIFFISDNASYMKLAYSHLSPFLPKMKHNCCLAHILNLIGETWIDFQKFELVDRLVSNFKAIFVYNSQRKIRWKEHLLRNNVESPTLAPLPVKTRWNSWFSFLYWIKPIYPHVITFINTEYSINHDSKAIRYLQTFCEHHDHVSYVEIFIFFITYNCGR